MKIEAIIRFNHHEPGEIFDAEKADAEKWTAAGYAQKPGNKAEDKGEDKPPEDKALKEPAKKK